jgi:hypothetical protein
LLAVVEVALLAVAGLLTVVDVAFALSVAFAAVALDALVDAADGADIRPAAFAARTVSVNVCLRGSLAAARGTGAFAPLTETAAFFAAGGIGNEKSLYFAVLC